jgi:hypothetical protein
MPLDYHRDSAGNKARRACLLKNFPVSGKHKKGRVLFSQNTAFNPSGKSSYVPSCQLARYFFCAAEIDIFITAARLC